MKPETREAIAVVDADYAGRIAAAAIASQRRRDVAMLDVPYIICGFPIRLMTLDDYLALGIFRNAYVVACHLPAEETEQRAFWAGHDSQLLWYLSPGYSREDKARDKFLAALGAFDFTETHAEVCTYIAEIFADAPRGPEVGPDDPPPMDPVGVSFSAHWIARIAARFPWSREAIRSLPLPELFQYLRIIAAEKRVEKGEEPVALDNEIDHLWAEKNERINALVKGSA